MRKSLILAALLLPLALGSCAPAPTELEISFDYTIQRGPGSNQWAVWVENEDGDVVKTLFVSHFTALGRSRDGSKPERGYTYRPSCAHLWVERADANSLSDEQLDAFTGATPAEDGLQSYVWDFTDQDGNRVADGTYKVWIEADLHDWTIQTWCCEVSTTGKPGVLESSLDYSQPDEKYEGMIGDVKFELK